jgi:L-seryl-tRNA(Ser) seleniumtransferase
LTLAALEATLLSASTPVALALHADADGLRQRCAAMAARLGADVGLGAEVVPSVGAVGGGGAPGVPLPGWAVALPVRFAVALRLGDPCVVARVEHDRCLLDLRCIPPEADEALTDAVLRCR